ncbi:MAG: hypothetical protein RBR74_08590, partial [Ignavibacteriaceae bacterium]|nr:hypothetical protein [Ignavibacteriaceae bacterium]
MNEVFYTIKSYFGFLLFIVDELLFQKASNKGESVLFIHTAGLGDLVHSTKIINTLSKSEFKIYFLVKSTHLKFYDEYNGNVRILGVNYSKYRRNLLYRYFFLKKLRENKFRYSFILNHHRLITD